MMEGSSSSSTSMSTSNLVKDGEEYFILSNDIIGRGAYSVVFLGRTKAGKYVAVKHATKRVEINAMRTEVELLKLMKDVPNIVQYIGSVYKRSDMRDSTHNGLGSESYSFAMEYARESLESILGRAEHLKGLPMNMLIDLTVDCADALSALHHQNIAHRDIKHMNILTFPGSPTNGRRSNYVFKLCDLGCARAQEANEMNTLVGTPNMLHPYLAAELVRNHDWHTKTSYTAEQCDLWSLGCTLYYCATGKFPFPHDNADRNLYFQAVTALTRNPDAIGMIFSGTFRNELSKRTQFEFKPINELPSEGNKFPKWFVYVFSCLIRMFFHNPSIRSYSDIATAMKNATRKTFLSIDQLSIVDHCDMSQAPHISHSFPSLASCLGYSNSTHLHLMSLTSTQVLDGNEKKLGRLHDDCYLVIPMCEEVKLRTIKPKNGVKKETADLSDAMLTSIRKLKIFNGISSLNEADELFELFNRVSKILATQFSLLIEELSREEQVQIASRFAVYIETASIPMRLFDSNNPESRQISEQCAQKAKETRVELDRHTKVAIQLEEMAKKLREQAILITLDNRELPGIREELSKYQMTEKAEILGTTEYSQDLTDLCLKRWENLMDQIFEKHVDTGKNKLKQAMDLAGSLRELREKYRRLQMVISECVGILETPFQAMKNIVNQNLEINGIDESVIRRSVRYNSTEWQENRQRLKTSHQTTQVLAKQLEIELANLGSDFTRLGDTLLRERSESLEKEEGLEEKTLTRAKEVGDGGDNGGNGDVANETGESSCSSHSSSNQLNFSSESGDYSGSYDSTPSPIPRGKSFFAAFYEKLVRNPD